MNIDDEFEKRIRQLESEVARLTDENRRLRNPGRLKGTVSGISLALAAWSFKKFLGSGLVNSSNALGIGLEAWREGREGPPVQAGVDFATAAMVRITRIGIFRIAIVAVAGVIAAAVTIGQFVMLSNQNDIIETQKRVAAMDNYVFFLLQEEAARRLLGSAFKHGSVLKDLDLDPGSSISVPPAELRPKILEAIPSEALVREIVEKCGISLLPVQDPILYGKDALKNLDENGVGGARLDLQFLRRWLKKAADTCADRVDLMKEMRKEMEAEFRIQPTKAALPSESRVPKSVGAIRQLTSSSTVLLAGNFTSSDAKYSSIRCVRSESSIIASKLLSRKNHLVHS